MTNDFAAGAAWMTNDKWLRESEALRLGFVIRYSSFVIQ